MLDVLNRVLKAREMQKYAERMGYDAGKNGSNTTNSHFAIFCRPEFTRAWERGKARADRESKA